MRTAFRILVVIALLAVQLYAVYAVLHPHVDLEYRAFYIDHTMKEWNPKRYNASPEEGITFSKSGFPGFVLYGSGFSYDEPGGRWTDTAIAPTAKIFMNRDFSGPLCIQFVARPAYSQWKKRLEVAFGSNVKYVTLSSLDPAAYQVGFANAQPANMLEFRLEGAVPSNKEFTHSGEDDRHLGVLLIQLKIRPSVCESGS
jgi:hypothetical protein